MEIGTNLVLQISGANVLLRWESVQGATSYKVYSSANSHTGFAEDLTSAFSDTTWTAPFPAGPKYYRVTALTE